MFSEQQFTQEIQTHQGIIFKVCLLYSHSAEDREDLFQEIVLQAWKSIGNFRGESKFSTWLYQVSLNTAISWFKKENKKNNLFSFWSGSSSALADDPWGSNAKEDAFAEMYNAIKLLNKVDKALITLYLEDFDYKTIGEMLGITPNNVAVKMSRAKASLKALMVNDK